MTDSITSKDNRAIKQYCRLRNSVKARREQKRFVIEGLRLCVDALRSAVYPESLFFTEAFLAQHGQIVGELIEKSSHAYQISEELAGRMADTDSPQGVFCICPALDKSILPVKIENNGNYIALEDVADPSNMGTILRSAEAFGLDGVILSKACCDVFSPKVLRGSMGAVFRLRLFHVEDMAEWVRLKREEGFSIYAAVPTDSARSVLEVDFSSGGIVLVGNEANGLQEDTVQAASLAVTIPMSGQAESLNAAVAASILMWQFEAAASRKKRI